MQRKTTGGSDYAALLCSPSAEDRNDLSFALESLKIQMAWVTSSEDAVELAHENCFALILIDVDSDSEWRSTLERLRAHAPASGVLAYSRLPEERLWLDALDAGAFDFICKPFSIRELHWIVENALKAQLHRSSPLPLSVKARRAIAAAA